MKAEQRSVMDRNQLGRLLAKLADDISRGEKVGVGEADVSVPEDVKVHVAYKEKDGRGKLKLKISWALAGAAATKTADIKWVKKEMGRLLSQARAEVEGSRLPSAADTGRFLELCRDFQRGARPEWAQGTAETVAAAEELHAAVQSGDGKAARVAVDKLLSIRKRYHDRFK